MQQYFKDKIRKKRWLFHATNFQSLMKPCFIFCRILGMFPYNINVSTFVTSKLQYILSTVIVCTCCIIDVIIVRNFIIFETTMGTKIRNLEGVCYFTCVGFIMIFTHILNGSRMRLLQTILKISSKLPTRLYENVSRLIHIKDILGTILLIMEMIRYSFNVKYSFNAEVLDVLPKVFSIYCNLLVFNLNMLYINCICVLKICFKNINDNLAHIRKLAENDVIRCSPTLICYMQRNQFLLIEIKELKKQHLMISNAVKMLNIVFSPQLLATTVTIFSNMTFELYYFAVRWQNGSLLISFDKQVISLIICIIIYHFVLLTLLVWACETCKYEAYEVRIIIHDLLNNIIDEQIKDELRLFSLQTLHCKNIFWAKGLIVDATLVGRILGSITTYMLIMMQFLISLHSCDVKNL